MFFRSATYKGFYGDFVEAFYSPAYDKQMYSGYLIDLFLDFNDYQTQIPEGYRRYIVSPVYFTLNLPDFVSLLSDNGVIDNSLLPHYSPIKFPVLVNSCYDDNMTSTSPCRLYGIYPFVVLVTLTYTGTEWVQSYDPPERLIFWSFVVGGNVGSTNFKTLSNKFKASYNFLLPFPSLPFSSDNLLGGDSL